MSAKSNIPLAERKRLWRRRMIAEGRCTKCGELKTEDGRTMCPSCRAKELSYYHKNKDRIIPEISRRQKAQRETLRNYLRNRNRKKRQEFISAMGGKCVRCGFSDYRALQVDHVNGDGYLDCVLTAKSKVRGRSYSLKAILADTTGRYQLLCANCNWIKRAENEEHSGIEGVKARRERCAA